MFAYKPLLVVQRQSACAVCACRPVFTATAVCAPPGARSRHFRRSSSACGRGGTFHKRHPSQSLSRLAQERYRQHTQQVTHTESREHAGLLALVPARSTTRDTDPGEGRGTCVRATPTRCVCARHANTLCDCRQRPLRAAAALALLRGEARPSASTQQRERACAAGRGGAVAVGGRRRPRLPERLPVSESGRKIESRQAGAGSRERLTVLREDGEPARDRRRAFSKARKGQRERGARGSIRARCVERTSQCR